LPAAKPAGDHAFIYLLYNNGSLILEHIIVWFGNFPFVVGSWWLVVGGWWLVVGG
jgi:hypothetical protein